MADYSPEEWARQIEAATYRELPKLLARLESRRSKLAETEREIARLKLANKALSLGEVELCLLATEKQAAAGLRKLRARALAQAGLIDESQKLLNQLRKESTKIDEIHSLIGRTWKDTWLATRDPCFLKQSIASYEAALEESPNDYYPAINAATMNILAGEIERGRGLARHAEQLARKALTGHPENDKWIVPTCAEAELCLGNLDAARLLYQQAITAIGKRRWRDVSSTRKQARLLCEALHGDRGQLDSCFDLPEVLVFAGHMPDAPGYMGPPRFPAEVEPMIAAAIEKELRQKHAAIGFSSAAGGSDILFLEMLSKSEDWLACILLAEPEADFRENSVPENWRRRYQKILRAPNIETFSASYHRCLPGSAVYQFANEMLIGMAKNRARQLDLDLRALAVWDEMPGRGSGGTSDFVVTCERYKVPTTVINPQRFLKSSVQLETRRTPIEQEAKPEIEQRVCAILFADVKGFSKVGEEAIPAFVEKFMGMVSRILSESAPPLVVDTWGDALYMIFPTVAAAGLLALRLRDAVVAEDWKIHHLPEDLSLRIALHCGPVFQVVDPVTRELSYTGRHVTQAARLEPVATAGEVLASDAFAALAGLQARHLFHCEYVGRKAFAKNYGKTKKRSEGIPLYRLVYAWRDGQIPESKPSAALAKT